ncbi:MAG: glutamate--tRNA ligase [Rickettsiales bacterium]|jgi:glutamyl-tRNA synthetase|nr:glutamate--tRNA ligase [Rickettsiales bacterium]
MKILADKIFPENLPIIAEIFDKYRTRQLAEGQKVTRYAPSPTGFMHLGNLYSAFISERVGHGSNGIFFLRIEDTDEKREVEGAVDVIVEALNYFDLKCDEGRGINGVEVGMYGPYTQSHRKHIYQAFVKHLVENGRAYPCFCSEEELETIINQQKAQNCPRLGYYGNWAKYRNFPIEEAMRKIENNEKYVVRFKSLGNFNNKVVINDVIRGNLEFPENDLDVVIMKKNGLPTYHFAHVVDDFLMGTTTVVRGDEWMPSLPLHVQLFQAMKWKAPKYAHVSPLLKIEENENKRKLSKRKDPEANVEYFREAGYPKESVLEYLLNLANPGFEDWKRQNPNKKYSEFSFNIKKMNVSGALFDLAKLNNISRDVIGRMSSTEMYDDVTTWAEKYDKKLFDLILKNREYVLKIFGIERENVKNPRKDIAKWSDIGVEIECFFELEKETVKRKLMEFPVDDVTNIIKLFLNSYNEEDSNQQWFEKLKIVAKDCGYAGNIKEYKENPSKFKGDISQVAKILRIVITGREQSPDLYSIMKVLGRKTVIERLDGLFVEGQSELK